MFQGFPDETTQFFLDVRFHNNTSWYEENKERYYSDVRSHFYSLIDDLAPVMLSIDNRMEVRPFKCLSRLRRDVRFTKDKSPYRDHLWFGFHPSGEEREGSIMFWFELRPESFIYGLGFWGENKPVNERVRRTISSDPGYVRQLLSDCQLEKHHLLIDGSTFKRMNIPENLSDELRLLYSLRDPLFIRSSSDMSLVRTRELMNIMADCFQSVAPLYKFYRGYMDEEIAEKAQEAFVKSDFKINNRQEEEW